MEDNGSTKPGLYYVMWCNDCQTAGLDALECCPKPKQEIGWVEVNDSTGTQG